VQYRTVASDEIESKSIVTRLWLSNVINDCAQAKDRIDPTAHAYLGGSNMKRWLGLILIGSIAALVGCGSAPLASEEGSPAQSEDQNIGQQSQKIVCDGSCAGFYYCPTDGTPFYFDPPTCGISLTTARIQCRNYCGTRSCVYGGGCNF
jgi:hypothetical protein